MKTKIIMLSVLGAASFGLTQAANAGWDSGDCGATPCIEYGNSPLSHFDVNDTDRSDWHGVPGTGTDGTLNNGADPFIFSGDTNLVCDGIAIDCTLSLSGYTRIAGSNPYNIGIMVSEADVTGGLLCGLVDVGGFPWYIDQNNEHGPYSDASDVGIPYPITSFIGSIGAIDIDVSFPPIHKADMHMHDVTYNNSDTFSFGTGSNDSNLYYEDETLSGCTVSGDLVLQNGDYLTIH